MRDFSSVKLTRINSINDKLNTKHKHLNNLLKT